MAGVSVTETWGSRVTSTMALFLKKKPVDQIFAGNLLLGILFGAQSRANRMTFPLKANRILKQGGRLARIPVRYKRSSNVTSFSQADELTLNIDDIHTMAQAKWAYYKDSVVVTWQEAQENSGEAALFSLVQERTENALDTLKERIDTDLYSTGDAVSTGNGGKNIIGLQHLLPVAPSTGTVWNLNRATYSWWRNQSDNQTGTFASDGIVTLLAMQVAQSGTNGEDPPTLWLTTNAQWQAYHAVVAAVQRAQITLTSADYTFRSLEFMGAPVFYSSNTNTNTWYGLNLNYMVALLQKGAQFQVIPYGKGSGKQMLDGIWHIVFGGQIGFERFDRQSCTVFTG